METAAAAAFNHDASSVINFVWFYLFLLYTNTPQLGVWPIATDDPVVWSVCHVSVPSKKQLNVLRSCLGWNDVC